MKSCGSDVVYLNRIWNIKCFVQKLFLHFLSANCVAECRSICSFLLEFCPSVRSLYVFLYQRHCVCDVCKFYMEIFVREPLSSSSSSSFMYRLVSLQSADELGMWTERLLIDGHHFHCLNMSLFNWLFAEQMGQITLLPSPIRTIYCTIFNYTQE